MTLENPRPGYHTELAASTFGQRHFSSLLMPGHIGISRLIESRKVI